MLAAWQILDAATAVRKRLLLAGFAPTPTEGKAALVPGWQTLVATEADIDSWFHRYDSALNTGILTRTTPAVDIDVYDPETADEIEALLWEMIGSRGLVRFGQQPKRAALFRTETPFKKILTPNFVSPSGKRNKVEVLCDGQQIVVFGTHPDTGKPYAWHGGEPGNIDRADLPELTQAMATNFVGRAAEIMRAQGWPEEQRKTNGTHPSSHEDFDAMYGSRERKYALAALQGCADELAVMAPESGRNDKLNALAFRLGTMCARGWISRDEITDKLLQAAAACRLVADEGEGRARATLNSGLGKAEDTPHPDLADEAPIVLEPLPYIDMSTWRVGQQPLPEWSVHELIPRRNVFLLSGDGAAGKSLLSLQLGIAHALGKDWLGTMPEPGPFLYFGAEDERNELYRRIADILKHYHADFADLQDQVRLLSYAGEDAVLGFANRAGIVTPTQLYDRLFKAAVELKPAMICIDTAADTFVGSEIDRSEVRQFIGLLRRLAIQSNGHVFVNSHVSLTGISSGSGLSGSTAWHNSVRGRGYLLSVKTDKDEEPDPTLRRLEFKKNNYGPVARSINLRWQNGVYVPIGGVSSVEKLAKEHASDRLFKTLLDRFNSQGRNTSDKPASRNFAPTVFAKEAEAKKHGVRKADFENAMRRLFAASEIAVEPYGAPSRGTTRLISKEHKS